MSRLAMRMFFYTLGADTRRGRFWVLRVVLLGIVAGGTSINVAMFFSSLNFYTPSPFVLLFTLFLFLQCEFLCVLGILAGPPLGFDQKENVLALLFITELSAKDILFYRWLRGLVYILLHLAANLPILFVILGYGGASLLQIMNLQINTLLLTLFVYCFSLLGCTNLFYKRNNNKLLVVWFLAYLLIGVLIYLFIWALKNNNLHYNNFAHYLYLLNPLLFLYDIFDPGKQLLVSLAAQGSYIAAAYFLLRKGFRALDRLPEVANFYENLENNLSQNRTAEKTQYYWSFLQPCWIDWWSTNPVLRLTVRRMLASFNVSKRMFILLAVLFTLMAVLAVDCRSGEGRGFFTNYFGFSMLGLSYLFLLQCMSAAWSVATDRTTNMWEPLLSTSLSDWQIILGKYFAAIALTGIPGIVVLFYFFVARIPPLFLSNLEESELINLFKFLEAASYIISLHAVPLWPAVYFQKAQTAISLSFLSGLGYILFFGFIMLLIHLPSWSLKSALEYSFPWLTSDLQAVILSLATILIFLLITVGALYAAKRNLRRSVGSYTS